MTQAEFGLSRLGQVALVVNYQFNVTIYNDGPNPITSVLFELGANGINYYQNLNVDVDAFPDYLDTDDDGDGIADHMDNAPCT